MRSYPAVSSVMKCRISGNLAVPYDSFVVNPLAIFHPFVNQGLYWTNQKLSFTQQGLKILPYPNEPYYAIEESAFLLLWLSCECFMPIYMVY